MNVQGDNKMVKFGLTVFVILSWLCAATWSARTVSSHINQKDINRLQKVFADGLSSNDLQSIYYASLNIQTTNVAQKEILCKKILTLHADSKLNDFEKDFYLIGSNKELQCSKVPETLLMKTHNSVDSEWYTTQEAYYRIAAQNATGVQVNDATKAKIVKRLQDLLKKDDTLAGLGYAFNGAIVLGTVGSFITNRVEDAIVQADEVDGRLLQFEGGLSITALVINGAFGVAKAYNKPSPVTAEQAVKFAEYFLSRRSVQTAKGAHVLIEALKTLSSDSKVSPVCMQLIGNGKLEEHSPILHVALVDLLGKTFLPVQSLTAKILIRKDNSVLAEKVTLMSKSSDKTTFVGDLTSFKPMRGIYLAHINADGIYKQKLQFKILGRVKVHSVEVGIAESDASTATRKQGVIYPNKLKETLSADSTQKLLMKVILVDESNHKPIIVHQVFVRLQDVQTDKEIIYVAEPDNSKSYKFEMDVGSSGKNFNYKSGTYNIYMTVGDPSISNSFDWLVADVELKFSYYSDHETKTDNSILPEIIHQFRVPEKRPPRIVSDIFTGLCITPLILLFVLWGKLGINIHNFTVALSTIGFHVGFGGILTLFFIFWLQLNMFETLRLLIPIAVFAFLTGNRLLRRLHAQRTAKNSKCES